MRRMDKLRSYTRASHHSPALAGAAGKEKKKEGGQKTPDPAKKNKPRFVGQREYISTMIVDSVKTPNLFFKILGLRIDQVGGGFCQTPGASVVAGLRP